MPGLPNTPPPPASRKRGRQRPPSFFSRRWVRYFLGLCLIAGIVAGAGIAYLYSSYATVVNDRLHGERERSLPRVFARPVELRQAQTLSQQDLISRLNELGYAHRPQANRPGEFAVGRNAIALRPRNGRSAGKVVRVSFVTPPARRAVTTKVAGNVATGAIQDIEVIGDGKVTRVELDAPLLTDLMTSGLREKRRRVPLASLPPVMRQAVLSIEDQRFYSHPGINLFRTITAVVGNLAGKREVVGGSTITQQLARMFFFADEFNEELRTGTRGKSWESRLRKGREILMSIVLERRASKDEILELYLNDVYLGQRGSFAIHGVAEASRIFFGKDVSNLSVGEAALIAGVIHNPGLRSPFVHPDRAVERRNVVLRAMAGEKVITPTQLARALKEPLQVVVRSVDNEAPYFVDMVSQEVAKAFPGVTTQAGKIDVYTSLDLNMQRAALDAVRRGLANVDALLAKRRRARTSQAQVALLAIDPRTGEILAMVGGRSYNQSQYNRATEARRQPGSVFKPFVFLSAFERAAAEGLPDFTPASLTSDEPGVIEFQGQTWEPRNYDEYGGEMTWRRTLAKSRNLGTIRVGEKVGFDYIANLWQRVGVGTPPKGYPAITLGVFELTPFEVAQAYTIFTNAGAVRPLRALTRIQAGGRTLTPADPRPYQVARADTTFLVTNMMRSVLNEGTGASARGAGFSLDAAGKSGTTNDLRDAWFAGFTPELLTIVWVGYDNNQPLGLSGSAAALPIWTDFMKAALAGRGNKSFTVPSGITFVDIDPETGKLATPLCPRTFGESFLSGTEPTDYCELHAAQ